MSYYWFNRQELLQKAKNKYHNCGGKEKAAEYYLENRVFFLKEQVKHQYRNLSEEQKEAKSKYGKNRYRKMK